MKITTNYGKREPAWRKDRPQYSDGLIELGGAARSPVSGSEFALVMVGCEVALQINGLLQIPLDLVQKCGWRPAPKGTSVTFEQE